MARSGRSRSSRESRSSDHPRSWSARVRNPAPSVLADIPSTLPGTSRPRRRTVPPGRWDEAGRAAPRRRDRRRPGPRGQRGRLPRRRRRSSSSPTAWAATTAATSPARSWSRSSAGSPTTATTPRRGADVVAATLARVPAPDRGVRRAAGQQRPAPVVRRHHRRSSPCWSRTTTARSGCWPTSATPGSTGSPTTRSSRSASTTASSRSWSRPAASPATTPPPTPSGT